MASNNTEFSGPNHGLIVERVREIGKVEIHNIHNNQKRESLPNAQDAPFHAQWSNPRFCYPGTRLQIQGIIHQWIKGDEGHIFWLNGLAGAGKSTIARTIAQDCSKEGDESLWVTSFFFSWRNADVRDATKFVPSIANQLATYPKFNDACEKSSSRYPGILNLLLKDQWEDLVRKPLSKLVTDSTVTLLIVIDALDECQERRDILAVLDLIRDNTGIGRLRFRFLISSRPEDPISFTDETRQCALQSLPADGDIRTFLEGSLTKGKFCPDQSQIDALVKTAGGLFICAETACGYIMGGDKKTDLVSMKKRLNEMLESHRDPKTQKRLDEIYSRVLDSSHCDYHEDSEKLSKVLIKSIVVLLSPLCLNPFCELLQTDVEDTRDNIMNKYPAIIDVPKDESSPLCIHHVCFSEFIFDEKRSGASGFYVNSNQAHEEMTGHCIRVMRENLKQTLCDCMNSCVPITEMEKNIIASEVQYSCRHWMQHLIQSGNMKSDTEHILSFLKENFMHWLAVMSIIRRISEAVKAINKLTSFFGTAVSD